MQPQLITNKDINGYRKVVDLQFGPHGPPVQMEIRALYGSIINSWSGKSSVLLTGQVNDWALDGMIGHF